MVGPVDLDGSPWQVLGVEPTSDTQVIRRAYAALVRQYRPDSHPLEFAKVREAYEHALEMARHLQWQEEIDAAEAVGQAEPAEATAESVGAPEPAPQAPAEVAFVEAPAPTPAPTAAPATAPEAESPEFPVFDPHQALSELATTYNDKGDAAAGALLREHIAQTAQSTIDARLDYEWLFLRSLLVSDTPPLALVFEGDRCFRWSGRLDDVARMFDDRGARRLAELIDMADEWMFSRSFAANPWQRRLFADPADRMPWFGMTSLVFGARNVVTRWAQQCEALQTPALEGRLHPVACRRLEGRVLLSSDVVLGLLGAWLVLSVGAETGFSWWVLLLGVGVAVLLAGACVGLRWVNRQPWMARVHALKPWTSGWRLVVAGTVVGAAFIGALMFSGSDQPVLARIAAGVVSALLFTGFVLAIGGLFWSIAFAIETLLSQLLLKPLWAVSAQSFRSVRDDASGWTPMTLVQKVRAMPAAMSADRAARKRNEAERALREPFEKPKSSFNGWWLFFLIVIVINAIRVLSGK